MDISPKTQNSNKKFPSTPIKKRRINTQAKGYQSLSFFDGPTERKDDDGSAKHVYTCNTCFKEINGTNVTNLASHLQRKHPEIYEKYIFKTESIEIKRLKLLQNCVSIVALGGRPFTSLTDYGFQQIIEADLNNFSSAGIPLNLKQSNQPDVHEHLHISANEVRESIQSAVNGRPISVQLDIGSRKGRSFFGIDIQYNSAGQKKLHNIGIIELNTSHTSENLLKVYHECLERHKIYRKQVISITADSGRNLRKMIRTEQEDLKKDGTIKPNVVKKLDFNGIMASSQNKEHIPDKNAENNDEEILVDNEIEAILASGELTDDDAIDAIFEDCDINPNISLAQQTLLSETVEQITTECEHVVLNLTDMTCFAHNLQLAVKDALEALPKKTNNILDLCRRTAKVLRLNSTKMIVQEAGLQMNVPCLDVETRWSSLYNMVRSISFS